MFRADFQAKEVRMQLSLQQAEREARYCFLGTVSSFPLIRDWCWKPFISHDDISHQTSLGSRQRCLVPPVAFISSPLTYKWAPLTLKSEKQILIR